MIWACVCYKETSHPNAEEDKEGKEKEEVEEKTEEQAGYHEEGGDLMKPKDVEVKGAGDWLRDQEDESNGWPRERVCHTHERAIPIQQTVEALDITEEGKWKHTRACTWIN